jgi:hypothetical protein
MAQGRHGAEADIEIPPPQKKKKKQGEKISSVQGGEIGDGAWEGCNKEVDRL